MLITSETKYSEIVEAEKYFTAQSVEKLKKAAEETYGSMYDLTFSTFHACTNGDFSHIIKDAKDPTVLQIYWCKRFADFVKEFAEALKNMQTQQTPDEKKAAKGLLQTDWAENMLVFLQDFFGLRSFKEAENITVGEILIAKRARFNEDTYRRNIARIQTQKITKK